MPLCSADEQLFEDECVPACAADEERDAVDRRQCLPRCGAGQERFDGECVAECFEPERRVDGECVGPSAVVVNTVGYPPVSRKVGRSTEAGATFQVVDVETDKAVLKGRLSGPRENTDTDQQLWFADFSKLERPGEYLLRVAGVGDSARFRIAEDVYLPALRSSMLGFYGLRCGTEVSYEEAGATFAHDVCHVEDAYSSLDSDEQVEATGGWHDAGDYGKYVSNGAFSVGMLLLAWEHFQPTLEQLELEPIDEHGGSTPDFLDEVKWELDWLLTMQQADGAVAHKLTAADFSGFIMPERDLSLRALSPISAEATADFAAALAMAARVLKPFDASYAKRCAAAALRAFEFLLENPNLPPVDLTGFSTGSYKSRSEDDGLWAAAEVWVSTGDERALEHFEEAALALEVSGNWDWANLGNMGVFSYLSTSREGRDEGLVMKLTEKVIASADTLVETSEEHGYGRGLGDYYDWGGNGSVARSTLNLHMAYLLTSEGSYHSTALAQLDHLFGVNVFSRSQVTGVGSFPPLYPHHRPSGADDVAAPWPGLLVGGANPPPKAVGVAVGKPAMAWQDVEASYWSNEIAINWNAALVYALAWFSGELGGAAESGEQ